MIQVQIQWRPKAVLMFYLQPIILLVGMVLGEQLKAYCEIQLVTGLKGINGMWTVGRL